MHLSCLAAGFTITSVTAFKIVHRCVHNIGWHFKNTNQNCRCYVKSQITSSFVSLNTYLIYFIHSRRGKFLINCFLFVTIFAKHCLLIVWNICDASRIQQSVSQNVMHLREKRSNWDFYNNVILCSSKLYKCIKPVSIFFVGTTETVFNGIISGQPSHAHFMATASNS